MTIAIELPDQFGPSLKSGEKNVTFQLEDEIAVGDVVTITAGGIRRKIRIKNKVWIPENQMGGRIRQELLGNLRPEDGFSGAFKIDFEYADQPERRPRYGEDVDRIAKLIRDHT
jgi:hypothetical protein